MLVFRNLLCKEAAYMHENIDLCVFKRLCVFKKIHCATQLRLFRSTINWCSSKRQTCRFCFVQSVMIWLMATDDSLNVLLAKAPIDFMGNAQYSENFKVSCRDAESFFLLFVIHVLIVLLSKQPRRNQYTRPRWITWTQSRTVAFLLRCNEKVKVWLLYWRLNCLLVHDRS